MSDTWDWSDFNDPEDFQKEDAYERSKIQHKGKLMQIQILSVQIQTVSTAKGSYQIADLAFKNLTYQGKVEGKKIASFGVAKASFEVLATAQPGEVYDVTVVKNAKGFNDWVQMTKGVAGNVTATPASPASKGAVATSPTAAVRSSYETPEERAKKQVYIIRQSSVSSAVAALSAGAKTPVKFEDVLDFAKKIEKYVFDMDLGADAFQDVPDFPAEVQ